jgi:hypothetical protein
MDGFGFFFPSFILCLLLSIPFVLFVQKLVTFASYLCLHSPNWDDRAVATVWVMEGKRFTLILCLQKCTDMCWISIRNRWRIPSIVNWSGKSANKKSGWISALLQPLLGLKEEAAENYLPKSRSHWIAVPFPKLFAVWFCRLSPPSNDVDVVTWLSWQ